MKNDQEIESMIVAAGKTAARVTPAQIDALMTTVLVHTYFVPGTTTCVAVAYLPNGFSLATEISACASPANFDPEIGIKIATDNVKAAAREELWKLEGYCLKKSL